MSYLVVEGGKVKTEDGTVIEGVTDIRINQCYERCGYELEIKAFVPQEVLVTYPKKKDLNLTSVSSFDDAVMQVCDELKLTFGPEPSELVDHILDIVKGAARMRIYNRDTRNNRNNTQKTPPGMLPALTITELNITGRREGYIATWGNPQQGRGRSHLENFMVSYDMATKLNGADLHRGLHGTYLDEINPRRP
jgi:hypothetical protein